MKKFDDNKNVRTYKDSDIVKRLLRYMKPYLPYFIISIIFIIIIVFIDLLPALMEGYLIELLTLDFDNTANANKTLVDIVFKFQEANNLSVKDTKLFGSLIIVGIYIVVIIISAFINYFTIMTLQRAGQKIVMNLRRDVFSHIESLSLKESIFLSNSFFSPFSFSNFSLQKYLSLINFGG